MPAIVLLGAQWGDEGKGKATDLLGSSVDVVVKYNGGNNAGHTVVSANAHVIGPHHRTVDKVTERFLGSARIGTTGRGIGPTYADKMNRLGVRIQDLFDESILRQKVEAALSFKNQVLSKIYNRSAIKPDEVIAELLSYVERLRP